MHSRANSSKLEKRERERERERERALLNKSQLHKTQSSQKKLENFHPKGFFSTEVIRRRKPKSGTL